MDRTAIRPKAKQKLGGPWVMILGFALIVVFGTLLLKLPVAARDGTTITWEDAFFTATSATTVTGLAVRNTANDFSFVGQIFILLLLQVGGVGFIAFSVLLYRIIGRRITLQTRFLVQQSLGTQEASGVVQLALYVLAITLGLEATGALLLWLRWRTTLGDAEAAWQAIFHAISSYCNAGFDLFNGAGQGVLFGYGSDWYTLGVLSLLIILGGLGITVMYDLWSYRYDRMLSLHTKLTLVLTATLTGLGMLVMLLDHDYNSPVLNHMASSERVAAEFFTVVSARTAGVTILPLEQLSESTQLMILLSMFIGAAPASMAGGVTTSTVAVLLTAVVATARGHQSAVTFGRTLPLETIAKAVAIMTVSSLLVFVVTMLLTLRHEGSLLEVVFEVVSAFSNTGYSLNFTSELDAMGRFLIAFTMFWGRLGPLTIVVALAQSEQPTLISYPEEPVIMG
ncbi:MAG TPA: potassium transporter TrkG [Caldilineaceae bacterium]|nr:potassium transporter TrkG [Caldilineaceae bacterium]